MFQYSEFTNRNIGFVHPEEQEKIRKARIFIAGVGGMGGAAVESIVRLGVGNLIIADFDEFEVSNLNRQIMATMDTVGISKVKATVERLKKINPEIQIQSYGKEWTDHLDEILPQVDFAINGCDDLKATIQLMRAGKKNQKTIIDAFTTIFPSVYVVAPDRARPEEMMKFPTVGLALEQVTPEQETECKIRELTYVMTHSSSAKYVLWKYANEMFAGKRKRFSMAPMVITTGNLMAYEAFKLILGKGSVVDERGIFLNPWTAEIEKPLAWPFSCLKAWFVRRAIAKNF